MSKFIRRGKSKLMFLPAVAGASPTRDEINAGTGLSRDASGMAGFQINNVRVPTPNLDEKFTPTIGGPNEVSGDTQITFYDDDASTTTRTVLADDTIGFIVRFPYGDVPTKRCEKWHVQSTGVNDEEWSTGNDPARFIVGLAVLDEPNKSAVVPA